MNKKSIFKFQHNQNWWPNGFKKFSNLYFYPCWWFYNINLCTFCIFIRAIVIHTGYRVPGTWCYDVHGINDDFSIILFYSSFVLIGNSSIYFIQSVWVRNINFASTCQSMLLVDGAKKEAETVTWATCVVWISSAGNIINFMCVDIHAELQSMNFRCNYILGETKKVSKKKTKNAHIRCVLLTYSWQCSMFKREINERPKNREKKKQTEENEKRFYCVEWRSISFSTYWFL